MSLILNIFTNILDFIYHMTNDYGVSIILFTLLINLMILPLKMKQKRSMKINQHLAERSKELKEKYPNDQEKYNQEISKLYKENPGALSGILLLFLQMPILITIYRLFRNNIADVSSILVPWIKTLSNPDPYFILPVLYILIQILPSILVSFNIVKNTAVQRLSLQQIIMAVVMALLIVMKSPAALGIYFITLTLINNIEQFFPAKNNLEESH